MYIMIGMWGHWGGGSAEDAKVVSDERSWAEAGVDERK